MIVGKDAQGKAIYGDENPLVLTERRCGASNSLGSTHFNRTYVQWLPSAKDYVTEWIVPEGQYFVLR